MPSNKYAVTLSDVASYETFPSLKAAIAFARRTKDDHGGAGVYSYGPDGLGDCHARWTRGEDGKVRKVNVG